MVFLALTCSFFVVVSAAKPKLAHLIAALDIGDEYMKVAAANPRSGYPLLDIGLNEQSER